ncbi:hypothetical protein B0H14DRAFT_2618185 [Mycena olivaceomarginata]|nr:hypothetical protein B0H14DRAFT_2618185 [Mycena olivaceomarginata]
MSHCTSGVQCSEKKKRSPKERAEFEEEVRTAQYFHADLRREALHRLQEDNSDGDDRLEDEFDDDEGLIEEHSAENENREGHDDVSDWETDDEDETILDKQAKLEKSQRPKKHAFMPKRPPESSNPMPASTSSGTVHGQSPAPWPCMDEIALQESDKVMNDPRLKDAPYTWGFLSVFTTSPNEYRKKRARKGVKAKVSMPVEPDEWEETPNGFSDDGAAFAGEDVFGGSDLHIRPSQHQQLFFSRFNHRHL